MNYALVRISDPADWQVYHGIRRASLWDEKGRSGYDETRPEEHWPENHALLLKEQGQGIATTRIDDLRNGTGVIRQVAVSASRRRQGHGRVLSAMVEDYARSLGIVTLLVNAAREAEGFYATIGWHRFHRDPAGPLEETDIAISMRKSLQAEQRNS